MRLYTNTYFARVHVDGEHKQWSCRVCARAMRSVRQRDVRSFARASLVWLGGLWVVTQHWHSLHEPLYFNVHMRAVWRWHTSTHMKTHQKIRTIVVCVSVVRVCILRNTARLVYRACALAFNIYDIFDRTPDARRIPWMVHTSLTTHARSHSCSACTHAHTHAQKRSIRQSHPSSEPVDAGPGRCYERPSTPKICKWNSISSKAMCVCSRTDAGICAWPMRPCGWMAHNEIIVVLCRCSHSARATQLHTDTRVDCETQKHSHTWVVSQSVCARGCGCVCVWVHFPQTFVPSKLSCTCEYALEHGPITNL